MRVYNVRNGLVAATCIYCIPDNCAMETQPNITNTFSLKIAVKKLLKHFVCYFSESKLLEMHVTVQLQETYKKETSAIILILIFFFFF